MSKGDNVENLMVEEEELQSVKELKYLRVKITHDNQEKHKLKKQKPYIALY